MRRDSANKPARKRYILGKKVQDQNLDPPAHPRREIWLELMAVMAIGVIPNALFAFCWGMAPPMQWPYWLDTLWLSVRSFCVSVAVLYIIYRSNEPWGRFGFTRPRLIDLPVALLLPWALDWLWGIHWMLFQILPDTERLFAPPVTSVDYAQMIFRWMAVGFMEELVFRAYLITRLEFLLGSRAKALFISAVLFAMIHLQYGMGLLVFFMATGIMFGVIYLVLRRIWPLAVGHALANISADLQNAMVNAQ